MIAGECVVFLSMFAGGMLAAMIAIFLLTLGGGSKVARAIFDFLSPIAVGAIFFFALYDASGGVFRLYALVAFALGMAVFCAIYRRSLPLLRRVFRRVIVPIKSLENRVMARLEPYRKRWDARMEERRTKRAERRTLRAEERGKRRREKARVRLEKKEKAEKARRLRSCRKRLRGEAKEEGRSASAPSSLRQSH